MAKKTKSNRKKREVFCVSIGVDTARVIHRVAKIAGRSRSALIRFIMDAWAKSQKRGA